MITSKNLGLFIATLLYQLLSQWAQQERSALVSLFFLEALNQPNEHAVYLANAIGYATAP